MIENNNKTSGKLFHGVIPAFLLAVCVGQIYAFTNMSSDISTHIGTSRSIVQFAFSLGIFFLGMGAAFFGRVVERNIRLATIIGTSLFLGGLAVSNLAVVLKSIPLLYLGYGLMIGLGTGIIYISPVKTMMLWFSEHKAMAASIPIISFGLGSTFSTILHQWISSFGIERMFLTYAFVYLPIMAAGCVMLRKPVTESSEVSNEASSPSTSNLSFSYLNLVKNGFFLRSWLFMFLNISCGLMLIPLAKQMMGSPQIGYSVQLTTAIIAMCGVFNGAGRFVFAWWSDALNERRNILLIILCVSIAVMTISLHPLVIGFALLVINACYGAGFSVIPGILADHYGMDNISKIHGAVLSAWGVAGLVGNQLAIFVGSTLGFGYHGVVVMLILLYSLNLWNACIMAKK